jgi:hypothetical protein
MNLEKVVDCTSRHAGRSDFPAVDNDDRHHPIDITMKEESQSNGNRKRSVESNELKLDSMVSYEEKFEEKDLRTRKQCRVEQSSSSLEDSTHYIQAIPSKLRDLPVADFLRIVKDNVFQSSPQLPHQHSRNAQPSDELLPPVIKNDTGNTSASIRM